MKTTLKNKIVFITGCSSGIGKASALQFASQGAKLILTARRMDLIESLAQTIKQKLNTEVLPIQLDIQDKSAVLSTIKNLPAEWQKIDILVNNAGLALGVDKMQDANVDNWDVMINTNLHGLLYVTRAILPGMIARNSGHIVNIGSIAGHEYYPGGNIYCATKHAVKAISKSLRIDLLGKNIRVTEIDPGMVHTEFSEVRLKDKERANSVYQGFEPLVADDIADAIMYCTTRPSHVNISEIMLFPTAQASANHIYRA